MTDPFMLDQKAVEVALERLRYSVATWRQLQGTRSSSGDWTEAMEYQLQGLDGSIRNGIRDVKWSLDELGETLKLLMEHEANFADSEGLNSRRVFLEVARETLNRMEVEILLLPPTPPEPCESIDDGIGSESDSQVQPCMSQKQTVGNQKSKSSKSVSWHRHVSSSDGEVLVVDETVWHAAKSKLLRYPARLIKYRLWISVAISVVLFVLVLLVISVSKSARLQANHTTATATVTPTAPACRVLR